MCGICGIIEKKTRVDPEILKVMNDALYHRGPDDEGFYINNNIGLASRRLSIIDIQGGKQPIKNEDESIVVVFNGEIYNYIELRELLEKKGHKFRTRSDTEVIVHLYEEKGEYFPEYLNGMFAIALYDQNRNMLVLTRDRAGEKPLYFGDFPDFFIFSSELKSILKNPKVKRKINLKALNLYLTFDYVPSPFSIIDGIHKLKPGHTLIYSKGQYKIKKYFSMKKIFIPKSEVLERLDKLLDKSVKIRLRSDVPVGVFLSGGIDSSLVTYYASKNQGKIKTFNISFTDPSFDESKFAKKVSDFLGTEHIEENFDEKKMLEIFPDVSKFIDEPIGDASFIPTYLVSKIARKHLKVVLGGDGGDEIFGGYPTYFSHKIMNIYQMIPKTIRSKIHKLASKIPVSHSNFSLDFKIKKFLEGEELKGWERHIAWMGSFSEEEKKRLIVPYKESEISLSDFIKEIIPEEDINNFFVLDFKTYLSENVLVKLDRASMANSLEVRAPFLDPEIIDFGYSLPEELKVKGFKTKYVLRKLMTVKNFPREIINRPKKGFGIPVAKWINRELKETIYHYFSGPNNILNTEMLKEILKEHILMKKDNRKKIWSVFVFLLWKENYKCE
ncbi:MAG: asparagine synthase (glutamine-hydrolyzing) [Candidatus Calescibacterium sp.]|nr:asparagine synthase (glutamine-hydrolyzing) [Candidatus Calescibacterium sp.]MCX7733951.1 asparagine synthase (glutamine-hydrolyzing) [bacterium]MDW8086450.1 asparagine synthase (glutamine-hydrolyzing) [Candidatus Calescibacterium sp.]